MAIIYVLGRDENEFITAQPPEPLEVSTLTISANLKRQAGDGWIGNNTNNLNFTNINRKLSRNIWGVNEQ